MNSYFMHLYDEYSIEKFMHMIFDKTNPFVLERDNEIIVDSHDPTNELQNAPLEKQARRHNKEAKVKNLKKSCGSSRSEKCT